MLLTALAAAATVPLTAAPAHAQQASAPPIAPHDTVKLKTGALYRGVITQLVPDVGVEMLLVNGTTKVFGWTDIEYAGASDQMPSASPSRVEPPPPPPPQAPSAPELAFRAEGPEATEVTLYRVTGSASGTIVGNGIVAHIEARGFQSLCTAPCLPTLAPGTYDLALSHGGGRPVLANRVVIGDDSATLYGTYTSRSGLRLGGVIGGTVGLAVGLGLTVAATAAPNMTCETCSSNTNLPELAVGAALASASLFVGVILVTRRDVATLRISPGMESLDAPSAALLGPNGTRPQAATAPAGLTLRAAF